MRISLHAWVIAAGAVSSFAAGIILYPFLFPESSTSAPQKTAPHSSAAAPVKEVAPSSDVNTTSENVEPTASSEEVVIAPKIEDEEKETSSTNEATDAAATDSSLIEPQKEDEAVSPEAESENMQPAEVASLPQEVFPLRSTDKLLPRRSSSVMTSISAHLRQRVQHVMQRECDRAEKGKPCEKRQTIAASLWANPEILYKTQAAKLLQHLGKSSEENCIVVLEHAASRQQLMQTRLLVHVGFDNIRRMAEQNSGKRFLENLSGDEDWLSDLLYSGSYQSLSTALSHLNAIYQKYADDMAQPVLRRMATAVALEFGEGQINAQDMLARYELYRQGYKETKLNSMVEGMPCWQMRYQMSMPDAHPGTCVWGEPSNLAWLRDNVKLPAHEYTKAHQQLAHQLRNVAGDSIYSTDYLAPGLKHANFIVARAQREMGGGGSGAQSCFAAYAAAANGIPSLLISEPGHYSYAVRTFKGWQAGNTQHWNRTLHKTLWGKPTWGFLMLSEEMYANRAVSRTADLMLSVADFLAEQEKVQQAARAYEAVLHYQPTHWPALVRYAMFLKDRAAEDSQKWHDLHESVMSGIAKKHYQGAAVYLAEYVYPGLLPHVKTRENRIKLFEKLFNQFNGWGGNRWDLSPLLTAQIQSFSEDSDKKYYLQHLFDTLIKKEAYSAAVMLWGLEYMSQLQQQNSPFCDEVADVLTLSLRRTKSNSKQADATWAMLGEVCHSAARNRDINAFQLAGKMAYQRCRKNFPEYERLKLPRYDGSLCSSSGSLDSHGVQTSKQMADGCLLWGALQPEGGLIPARFEGKKGIVVQLKKIYEVTAVVCIFEEMIKEGREFYIETSDDGRAWNTELVKAELTDNILQFVLPRSGAYARYVRILREGDRSEASVTHVQVYGK